MALAPLATTADLDLRGIFLDEAPGLLDAFLAAASEAIRDAAGCPISRVTSTITIPVSGSPWLQLPGPVTSVSSVQLAGAAVTDHALVGGALYLRQGWGNGLPATVTVTLTHGLAEVPADIVDLTCRLVATAVAQHREGTYGSLAGLQSRTREIDDYRETDTYSGVGSLGPMELPPATRAWLRARFGASVVVTVPR